MSPLPRALPPVLLFLWMLVPLALLFSGCQRSAPDRAPDTPASLSLPAWEGPSAETVQHWLELDARARERELGGRLGQLYLQSRRAILRQALSLPPARDDDGRPLLAEEVTEQYQAALRRWARDEGPEAFAELGAAAWRAFQPALVAGIEAAEAASLPVLEWVATHPDHPSAERFASLTGDYFFLAERIGLRDSDGALRVPEGTERLVFEDWWVAQLRGAGRTDVRLAPPVAADLLRYRVTTLHRAPIDTRIGWVDVLYRDHGGLDERPVSLARAAVMLRSGHVREARIAVEATSGLDTRERAALMAYLEHRSRNIR